jgi:hypothetical protein
MAGMSARELVWWQAYLQVRDEDRKRAEATK